MNQVFTDFVLYEGWTPDSVTRAVRRLTIEEGENHDDKALAQLLLRWLVSAANSQPERLASLLEVIRPGSEPLPTAREVGSTVRGTVKWFSDAKGYGFISREEDGTDVFVHFSAIEKGGYRTLREGQLVAYQEQRGPKGFYAVRVSAA